MAEMPTSLRNIRCRDCGENMPLCTDVRHLCDECSGEKWKRRESELIHDIDRRQLGNPTAGDIRYDGPRLVTLSER